MARLEIVFDVKAAKQRLKEIAEDIRKIKLATRRKLRVAAGRNEKGQRITRAVYEPGRNLTSEEGKSLHALRKKFTVLCYLRAMNRGRNHLAHPMLPQYVREMGHMEWVAELSACMLCFTKRQIVGKGARELEQKISEARELLQKVGSR